MKMMVMVRKRRSKMAVVVKAMTGDSRAVIRIIDIKITELFSQNPKPVVCVSSF